MRTSLKINANYVNKRKSEDIYTFKTKIYTNLKNQILLSLIEILYINQTIMLKIYIVTQVPNWPIYVSRRNLILASKNEL